jgi:replicative DNA helicase
MGGALPHNLDAERAVLGAVLLDNSALDVAIATGLKDSEFFLDQNARIFAAMCRMVEPLPAGRGLPIGAIDTVVLFDELQRTGEFEQIGGAAYLSVLTDGMPRVSNIRHYALLVRDKALLRSIAHAANAIGQRAIAGEESGTATLDQAEAQIFSIGEDRIEHALRPVDVVLRDAHQRIEAVLAGNIQITGMATGYSDLDDLTGGLQKKELIVLAARPSIGKTALALNISRNVAVDAGLPVAIFSLEMSEDALVLRVLSDMARVNSQKFRVGGMLPIERMGVREAMISLRAAPLSIDDAGTSTVMEMLAKARRMKRDKGLALCVVDYLQLVTARGKFGTRNEMVGSVSRSLKAMAKELGVPVLALSQLTRAPERDEREPTLMDLRDSGEIEQDADVVMFIHRPGAFSKDKLAQAKTTLIIAKQRNGPTGRVPLTLLAEFTRFEPAAQQDEEGGGGSDL